MKFLFPLIAIVLASQVALAAKHTKTIVVDDDADDASSNTVVVHRHSHESNAVVRDIIPEFGLVMGDETLSGSSGHTGMLIGGAVDLFRFGGNWTFETGLQYKQMGTSVGNNSLTMNYITVPLAAKYYFGGERETGFYAKGGMVPGINVAHSETTTVGGQSNTADIQDANTLDLGIMVGVGGKLQLSRSIDLLLEADYVRGITSLYGPNAFNNNGATQGVPSINDTSIVFLTGVSLGML